MDFPYRTDYAKSGRSSCKGCKSPIEQGLLRLAVMVQSHHFDGKQPMWYHMKCFFKKQRPKVVDDIEYFENLRLEDQERIKNEIASSSNIVVPDKKGKKREASDAASKKSALKDYVLEYAKSGRATCRGCELKILKDEIRISKKDFESDIGKRYGGQDMWHHLNCFAKLRSELGFFECGDKLPGFKGLKPDDQKEVKKQIPAIKQEGDGPDVKKVKKEEDEDPIFKAYKEQTKIIYKHRDSLKECLNKKQVADVLEANEQYVPSGLENRLDALADIMTFGAFKPCKECNDCYFVFSKTGYLCHGNLTEWSKCNSLVKEPERKPFIIPDEYKELNCFKNYKFVKRTRVIKEVNPTFAVKKDEVDGKPKIERERPALYEMEFVILGNNIKDKNEIKKKIAKLGGKVVTKISKSVMAVISTPEEVEKLGSRMQEAESEGIHVVPVDFLDEAANKKFEQIPELVVKKSICGWGTDPNLRLPQETELKSKSAKSKSRFTKSVPDKIKVKLKNGTVVDPDSGLEDEAHVYKEGKDAYYAILGITDIQHGKNSYYKLQLLQADGNKHRFWVFRSWGRIGTTIGDTKLESFHDLHSAKKLFFFLYEDKTGNLWENRHNFVKVPGRMYPIDVEYGANEEVNMNIVESESKLKKPVQDLIRLIFDVNTMKKLMMEFELDTEKMPLGKLSKKQINAALAVLSELQDLIKNNGNQARFVDASNRFYTLVPHSFGINDIPVINTEDIIKQKIDMLENLNELEIAYNLMQSSGREHTVDSYYKQLNTEIDVIDRDSEEFAIINEYVKNTHAATHSNYKLEIEEVYTIKRQGEDKRFKPFKKLHNRKLLWHGSRVTNFAGILSQGLRIAPPEAPVTGYMFGKGIYFADMVSKSANYCCTNPSSSTGLLLLCEVALGDMYEKKEAEYIEKLPKGKHSTKGLGRTEPDPKASKIIDGVEVPLGKGVTVEKHKNSSLLYNEYIVYDIAQVKVKYLLKLNFKYKY